MLLFWKYLFIFLKYIYILNFILYPYSHNLKSEFLSFFFFFSNEIL